MATDLIVPGGLAPSNLHLRPDVTARFIDGDLYGICERMKEIDERLFAVQLEEGDEHAYAIMEHGPDGMERLVFRVKVLDGRVLNRLRELMSVPLDVRLTILEAQEHKWEEDRENEMHERLYEDLGLPMLRELEQCGFIQRPISYPKTGVTGGRGSKRRST